MNANICRPIIFYNNFLPAAGKKPAWDFCAFGVYDGVDVGEQIVSVNARDVLLEMWKHQSAFIHNLQGESMAQIVYALCYEEKEREQEFWDDSKLPFLFFCRLQFRGNIEVFRKNRMRLKNCINAVNGAEAMSYMTYDNSDLVIVIRAESYELGAGLINTMHQGKNFSFNDELCTLKNSFTVFAVEQNYIDRTEEEAFRRKLNQKKIDLVSIRVIERGYGRLSDLKRQLKEQFALAPILGIDDEVLIGNGIGWGDFLNLYCEKGELHIASQVNRIYIAGTTTTIITTIDNEHSFLPDYQESAIQRQNKTEEESKTILKRYVSAMLKRVRELESRSGNHGAYKELYIILNALSKFTEELFSDYIFFTILRPIRTLLELMERGMNDSYYEFIKSFNMYIQNSVKADRHAMQMMDLNTKIYDVPTKLNAFYTAYIYKVSEALNISDPDKSDEESHSYDFLVVPGVTAVINVVELYQRVSPKRRLLRVEIPENRLYDVCNVMIIFAHEAGHYVSTALRNREARYEHVLGCLSIAYVDYVMSFWGEQDSGMVPVTDAEWDNAKKRMKLTMKRMLDRELDKRYLEERQIGQGESSQRQIEAIVETNRLYQYYFCFLKQNLYRNVMDIMQSSIANVFGSFAIERSDGVRKDVWKKIRTATEHFLEKYEEGTTKIVVDTVFEQINSLYEESFSDLMSIFLLELDVKDYLNSIIKENEKQQKTIESLLRSDTLYRITLVLEVLYRGKKAERKRLNYDEDGEYLKERRLLVKAVKGMRRRVYQGWQQSLEPEEYRNGCFYTLLDESIYREVLQYLYRCMQDYETACLKKDSRICRISEELRDLYRLCRYGSNIEMQTASIEKFVYEYKREVYDELALQFG